MEMEMIKSNIFNKTFPVLLSCLVLAVCSIAYASDLTIPNTFSAGDTVSSSTMNGNFNAIEDAVNDNDSNISINEADISALQNQTSDYSGYTMPFTADGYPKNVIVLKIINSDGSTIYILRSAYLNSTEQISIDGILTTVPIIFRWSGVEVDTSSNITGIMTEIEAPSNESFEGLTNRESSYYDPATLVKTLGFDTSSYIQTCNGGGAIKTCKRENRTSGVFNNYRENNRIYDLLGPGTINGLAFADLRRETRYGGNFAEERIYAKGIGLVARFYRTRPSNQVIYYRVNGQTGGSLAGTPFASGELLDGLFF